MTSAVLLRKMLSFKKDHFMYKILVFINGNHKIFSISNINIRQASVYIDPKNLDSKTETRIIKYLQISF